MTTTRTRLCPMCGKRKITSAVLACQTCWFSLPQGTQIAIMNKPRGNVRARAFFEYIHEHGLSRRSPESPPPQPTASSPKPAVQGGGQ